MRVRCFFSFFARMVRLVLRRIASTAESRQHHTQHKLSQHSSNKYRLTEVAFPIRTPARRAPHLQAYPEEWELILTRNCSSPARPPFGPLASEPAPVPQAASLLVPTHRAIHPNPPAAFPRWFF